MTNDTKTVTDPVSGTQGKVTVSEASKNLSIGRKTIYRWIEKGLLKRYIQDNKTYVLLSEVRALCVRDTGNDTKEDTKTVSDTVSDTRVDTGLVTMDRVHYEGLLVRLGQLESEKRYLLEYKGGLEEKDKELAETKDALSKANQELRRAIQYKQNAEEQRAALEKRESELAAIRAEVERLKVPWWKRLFMKNLDD